MTAEKLEKKVNEIIRAYKGFNIFKDGSRSDKLFLVLLFVLFIACSGILFVTNVFISNFKAWIVSLIWWIAIVIFSYAFQQYVLKRETKIYIKAERKEINFLHYFEEKIDACGIKRDNYKLFIDYFTNELNFKKAYKTNELATYVTTIICPILIIFFTKNKEFEALIISIVGILVVPGIIFFINWFVHRKEYMYEGIIYYLNLGLLLENWDK